MAVIAEVRGHDMRLDVDASPAVAEALEIEDWLAELAVDADLFGTDALWPLEIDGSVEDFAAGLIATYRVR